MISLYLLLGAPGSGKGTFTSEFVRQTGCSRFSTGECFRSVMNDPSHPFYEAIRDRMDQADYVPDDLTMAVVRGHLSGLADGTRVLTDGFPRTLAQARILDEQEGEDWSVAAVFSLEVPASELANRLRGRRVCMVCGDIYHLELRPPRNPELCDSCGVPLTQRYDDTEVWIPKRLAAYKERSRPLVEYYNSDGRIIPIDGTLSPDRAVALAKAKLGEL